jgi:hypothetical protein
VPGAAFITRNLHALDIGEQIGMPPKLLTPTLSRLSKRQRKPDELRVEALAQPQDQLGPEPLLLTHRAQLFDQRSILFVQ